MKTKTLRTVSCAVCGSTFTARRKDAEMCSTKCRQRRHVERRARELALAMTSATGALAALSAAAHMTPED